MKLLETPLTEESRILSDFLSGQQRTLLRALAEKNSELANMYYGAIHVLFDSDNPEAIPLAAHAIREMMEKIPEILDVPTKALKESLKGKIFEIEDSWQATTDRSRCCHRGTWYGEIDESLRKLLIRLGEFFVWLKNHHPRRRSEIGYTLCKMDDSGKEIPQPLQDLNVTTWELIRDFFVAVAHHRKKSTKTEFFQWMDTIERFLLDRLVPRTFEDFEEIDSILREGSGDA